MCRKAPEYPCTTSDCTVVAVVPQACTTRLALKWASIWLSICLPFTSHGFFASLHPELAVLFHWLFSGKHSGFSFVVGGAGPWLLNRCLKVFLILSNYKRRNSNNSPNKMRKESNKTWLLLLVIFYRRHSPKLVSLLPPCLFFPFSLHSFLWLEFYFLWLYILCKCNLSIYNCEVELFMCYIS